MYLLSLAVSNNKYYARIQFLETQFATKIHFIFLLKTFTKDNKKKKSVRLRIITARLM